MKVKATPVIKASHRGGVYWSVYAQVFDISSSVLCWNDFNFNWLWYKIWLHLNINRQSTWNAHHRLIGPFRGDGKDLAIISQLYYLSSILWVDGDQVARVLSDHKMPTSARLKFTKWISNQLLQMCSELYKWLLSPCKSRPLTKAAERHVCHCVAVHYTYFQFNFLIVLEMRILTAAVTLHGSFHLLQSYISEIWKN